MFDEYVDVELVFEVYGFEEFIVCREMWLVNLLVVDFGVYVCFD